MKKSNLLTRDEFREGVFKRDSFKCVMCGSEVQQRAFSDAEYKKTVRDRIWENSEVKQKVLNALNSKEAKQKKAASIKKFSNTIEGKKQKSEATKGTVYINLSGITKRVKPNLLDEYLSNGWQLGNVRKYNEREITNKGRV